MVLEQLTNKIISSILKLLNKTVTLDEDIKTTIKEICNALLDADVSNELVLNICAKLKNDLIGKLFINKQKEINKIIYDCLHYFFDPKKINPIIKQDSIIMFIGLQGSGKTTCVTKLGYYLKQRKINSTVVCADTFRAGALDQLKQNACACGLNFYGNKEEKNPIILANDAILKLTNESRNVIIVDTSGRNKQCEELFTEMQEIYLKIKPDIIYFVIDATIGQIAINQAVAFNNALFGKIGGIIVTKLDSGAKGGGAITAISNIGCPISFISYGEHFEQFSEYDSSDFVNSLLGIGNLYKAYKTMEQTTPMSDEIKILTNDTMEGKFTFRHFKILLDQFEKMGSFSSIINLLPGNSLIKNNNRIFETSDLKKYLIIIDSMTEEEIDNPNLLLISNNRSSRIKRIIKGSGTDKKIFDLFILNMDKFKKLVSTGILKEMMRMAMSERYEKGDNGDNGCGGNDSKIKKLMSIMQSPQLMKGIISNIKRTGKR
jgi:signal recognition particle subunit SRP54